MTLSKHTIGDLIETYNVKCNIPNLTIYDVSGINREKEFFSPTVQVGSDTSNYKEVPVSYFACNLMHVGRDFVIPIAYNNSDEKIIVSPAYNVFRVSSELIIKEYFYMYLKKLDFDRYAAFCTDSSVRDGLEWSRFCDIEIDVPSLEEQQKVVDVYLAMVANQKAYEKGLEDLKLTCDIYIENLKRDNALTKIGNILEQTKDINNKLEVNFERGLNKEKGFVVPGAMSSNVDLSKRKIVRYNHFVYPAPHFGEQGTIGLYKGEACIMSQMYTTFKVKNEEGVSPDYLYLWFKRKEFMRYAFFSAVDSIRDTFDFEKLCEYEIPIPRTGIQKSIVEVFEVYESRKKINEQLKKQINQICPILIKGSIS
jgi:type I restriction enzyme S subunit